MTENLFTIVGAALACMGVAIVAGFILIFQLETRVKKLERRDDDKSS